MLGGQQKAVEGSLQHVVNEVRHLHGYNEILPESNTPNMSSLRPQKCLRSVLPLLRYALFSSCSFKYSILDTPCVVMNVF